jgi:hypothetical protein
MCMCVSEQQHACVCLMNVGSLVVQAMAPLIQDVDELVAVAPA